MVAAAVVVWPQRAVVWGQSRLLLQQRRRAVPAAAYWVWRGRNAAGAVVGLQRAVLLTKRSRLQLVVLMLLPGLSAGAAAGTVRGPTAGAQRVNGRRRRRTIARGQVLARATTEAAAVAAVAWPALVGVSC